MATFLRDDSDLSVLTGVASTTVGSIRLTGTTIGLESDTDLMTLGSSLLDVNAANIDFNGSILKFRDTSSDAATITLTQSTGLIECTSIAVTGNVTHGGDLAVTGDSTIGGDFTIGGDLTITGGKFTFGNAEFIHNETDDNITFGLASFYNFNATGGNDIKMTLTAGFESDAGFILKNTVIGAPKWSICFDGNDSNKLKFDAGSATVGAATKMELDQSGNLEVAGNSTIAGDLTITGGKLTFGNGELISNETDGHIQIQSTASANFGISILAIDGYDSFIRFYEGSQMRWSIGQDGSDDSDRSFCFDYNNTTVGAATKMNLDQDGNLEITGDLTVEGNDIKDNDGVSCITFDSSGNTTIANTLNAALTGDVTGTASIATLATNSTIVANNTADETVYLTFVDGATGTQGLETDTGLSYNPNSGVLTSTTFTGALSGNSATSTEATNVTVSANNTADETVYPVFVDGATGTQGIETDTGLSYNPNSNILTSTNFAGALTGNADTATLASTVTTADAPATGALCELLMIGAAGTTTILRDDALLFVADTHTLATVNVHASAGTMTADNGFIDGALTLTTNELDLSSGNFALDIEGDLTLDVNGGQVAIKDNSQDHFLFDCDSTSLTIYDDTATADFFSITVAASGATTIATVDDGAAIGHLILAPDGHVEFDNCAVGFDKLAGTFSTSGVLGNGGNSTDIDFRLGNKYELELTAVMSGTDKLNLIFPATSGNFILVIIQDGTGSRTVHADSWVGYAVDATACDNLAGADGTDGVIRWAGGSAPTLTTTADKSDIVSIYYDADNQTAFATASLNF